MSRRRNDSNKIAKALEALINAHSKEKIRHVLEEQQAVLLSDATLDQMRAKLAELQRSGDIELAERVKLHLDLLEDARLRGIATAAQRYVEQREREETTQREAFEALVALTTANTSDETLRILQERKTVLLSDAAFTWLREMIAMQRSKGDLKEATYMEHNLSLLEDARMQGIDTAWQRFQKRLDQEAAAKIVDITARLKTNPQMRAAARLLTQPHPLAQAPNELPQLLEADPAIYRKWMETNAGLFVFMMARTADATRRILEEGRAVLLSDTALALLRMFIALHRLDNKPESAEAFERTLRLLEDARTRGIATALRGFQAR